MHYLGLSGCLRTAAAAALPPRRTASPQTLDVHRRRAAVPPLQKGNQSHSRLGLDLVQKRNNALLLLPGHVLGVGLAYVLVHLGSVEKLFVAKSAEKPRDPEVEAEQVVGEALAIDADGGAEGALVPAAFDEPSGALDRRVLEITDFLDAAATAAAVVDARLGGCCRRRPRIVLDDGSFRVPLPNGWLWGKVHARFFAVTRGSLRKRTSSNGQET